MEERPLLAIFVGGKSRRMGEDKGLLPVPESGEPILDWIVRQGREAGLTPVLVGDSRPYAQLAEGVVRIDDEPAGAGPLAGLNAALGYAFRTGHAQVLAIACDMPYASAEALARVSDHRSDAIVLAPRRGPGAPWEPMLARYDVERLLAPLAEAIAGGQRSFQKLFSSIEVEPLPLSPVIERALQDWDSPEDIAR